MTTDGQDYLRCAECGTPIACLQNGCLVVKCKHHGELHVTVLRLVDLVREAVAKGHLDLSEVAVGS